MITIVLFLVVSIYAATILCLIYGFTKVNSFEYLGQKPKTKFSIVVPFRNEAENLPILLDSFSKLNYPMELIEFILVDDDSEERLQVADCRLQVSGRRLQGADFRLQITGFRLQVADCRFQVAGFRFQIAGFKYKSIAYQGSRITRWVYFMLYFFLTHRNIVFYCFFKTFHFLIVNHSFVTARVGLSNSFLLCSCLSADRSRC